MAFFDKIKSMSTKQNWTIYFNAPEEWPYQDDTDSESRDWTSCTLSHWMPFALRSDIIIIKYQPRQSALITNDTVLSSTYLLYNLLNCQSAWHIF